MSRLCLLAGIDLLVCLLMAAVLWMPSVHSVRELLLCSLLISLALLGLSFLAGSQP